MGDTVDEALMGRLEEFRATLEDVPERSERGVEGAAPRQRWARVPPATPRRLPRVGRSPASYTGGMHKGYARRLLFAIHPSECVERGFLGT